MEYGYKKSAEGTFGEVLERTRMALAAEEFGIITEIDVRATMQKKLGVSYDNYIILGACNPAFAHRALEADKEIGLLLPCNVIAYEDAGAVFVAAILPTVALSVAHLPELADLALVVEEKLKRAVDAAASPVD